MMYRKNWFFSVVLLLSGMLLAAGCAVNADNVVDNDRDDVEWVVFDDSEVVSASDEVEIGDNAGHKDSRTYDQNVDENGTAALDDTEFNLNGDSETADDSDSVIDSATAVDVSTGTFFDSAATQDTETGLWSDSADDSESVANVKPELDSSDSGTAEDTDPMDTGMETDSIMADDTATLAIVDTETVAADTNIVDTGDTDTDTLTETGTNADTGTTTETETETGIETDADTGTETNTETETNTDSETDTGTDADAGIYITFGSVWAGYGWTTTGSAEGGVISEDLDSGEYELGVNPLCISGATVEDYESQGGIGFNLNQDLGASGDDAALWVPSPTYTMLTYDIVTSTPLRIEIVNVDDAMETTYCAEIPGTGNLTGHLVLRGFETNCWDSVDNVSYNLTIGLMRVSVYAPGEESGVVDFDFCINELYPE